MRRTLLLVALFALVAAGAVTTATLAGDGGGNPGPDTSERVPAATAAPAADSAFARAAQRTNPGAARLEARVTTRRRHGGMRRLVVRSLANRLDVEPMTLGIALREALTEVHGRSFSTPEALAERKRELTDGLADALDRPRERVADAVRAEISDRLDGAVRIGVVTPETRTLALGCFDRPAECDLRALRWESGLGRFHHHRR